MYLYGSRVKPVRRGHTLRRYAAPLTKEELSKTVEEYRGGNVALEEKIIKSQILLILDIVGQYAATNSFCFQEYDCMVSAAMLKTIELVRRAQSTLTDNNITAFLSKGIHNAMSDFYSRNVSIVRIPKTTQHRKGLRQTKTRTLKDKHVFDVALTDINDTLERISKDDTEKAIIMFRACGYNDMEIAEKLQCSVTKVNLVRTNLRRRFDQWTHGLKSSKK